MTRISFTNDELKMIKEMLSYTPQPIVSSIKFDFGYDKLEKLKVKLGKIEID